MRARGGGLHRQSVIQRLSDEAGAYTVSKYAIDAVTRVLAAEFAEDNIRVNGIAPGMMTAKMPRRRCSHCSRARPFAARPAEDLVGALLYLCSDDSAFVNGQTSPSTVDGPDSKPIGLLTGRESLLDRRDRRGMRREVPCETLRPKNHCQQIAARS